MADSSNVIVAVRIRPQAANEGGCDPDRPIIQHLGTGCIAFDPPYAGGDNSNADNDGPPLRKGKKAPGTKRARDLSFKFDHVFSSDSTQEQVYEVTAKRVVEKVCNGFNSTVFAYGATGSGKTFTMVGTAEQPGVMVRAVEDLFTRIREMCDAVGDAQQQSFNVSISYLEVYMERIRDLLTERRLPSEENLPLNEDKNGVMSVRGLTEKSGLKNTEEVFRLLDEGNKRRTQCATDQNSQSSRSHAVLTITVRKYHLTQTSTGSHVISGEAWSSKLSLIDLAGSERASRSNNKGSVQKEGAHINESLLALAQVITALAARAKGTTKAAAVAAAAAVSANEKTMKKVVTTKPTTVRQGTTTRKPAVPTAASSSSTKKASPSAATSSSSTSSSSIKRKSSSSPPIPSHIPYRGSKLTRLLKDSLNGKCMTVMIAAISPSRLSEEDTNNTLKYANRAKMIKVELRQNGSAPLLVGGRAGTAAAQAAVKKQEEEMRTMKALIDKLTQENNDLKLKLTKANAKAGTSSTTSSSSSSSNNSSSSLSDSASLTKLESYRKRIETMYDTKSNLSVEQQKWLVKSNGLQTWKSVWMGVSTEFGGSVNVSGGKNNNKSSPTPSSSSSSSSALLSPPKTLDTHLTKLQKELTHSLAQLTSSQSQISPLTHALTKLNKEIDGDVVLGKFKSEVKLLNEVRELRIQLKEKEAVLSGTQDVVEKMRDMYKTVVRGVIQFGGLLDINTAATTSTTSSQSSQQSTGYIFTPSKNVAHKKFLEIAKNVLEHALVVTSTSDEKTSQQQAAAPVAVKIEKIENTMNDVVETESARSRNAVVTPAASSSTASTSSSSSSSTSASRVTSGKSYASVVTPDKTSSSNAAKQPMMKSSPVTLPPPVFSAAVGCVGQTPVKARTQGGQQLPMSPLVKASDMVSASSTLTSPAPVKQQQKQEDTNTISPSKLSYAAITLASNALPMSPAPAVNKKSPVVTVAANKPASSTSSSTSLFSPSSRPPAITTTNISTSSSVAPNAISFKSSTPCPSPSRIPRPATSPAASPVKIMKLVGLPTNTAVATTASTTAASSSSSVLSSPSVPQQSRKPSPILAESLNTWSNELSQLQQDFSSVSKTAASKRTPVAVAAEGKKEVEVTPAAVVVTAAKATSTPVVTQQQSVISPKVVAPAPAPIAVAPVAVAPVAASLPSITSPIRTPRPQVTAAAAAAPLTISSPTSSPLLTSMSSPSRSPNGSPFSTSANSLMGMGGSHSEFFQSPSKNGSVAAGSSNSLLSAAGNSLLSGAPTVAGGLGASNSSASIGGGGGLMHLRGKLSSLNAANAKLQSSGAPSSSLLGSQQLPSSKQLGGGLMNSAALMKLSGATATTTTNKLNTIEDIENAPLPINSIEQHSSYASALLRPLSSSTTTTSVPLASRDPQPFSLGSLAGNSLMSGMSGMNGMGGGAAASKPKLMSLGSTGGGLSSLSTNGSMLSSSPLLTKANAAMGFGVIGSASNAQQRLALMASPTKK